MRVRPTTMKAAKEEVEEVEPKKTGARPEMGLKEEARMLLMHSDDETWPDQTKKKWQKKENKQKVLETRKNEGFGGNEDFVVFKMLLFQNDPLKECVSNRKMNENCSFQGMRHRLCFKNTEKRPTKIPTS